MGIISFSGWLAEAPQWILACPEWLQNLLFQLYQTFIYQNRWQFFTNGLKITFIVTIGALLLGTILGLIVAIIRTSHDSFVNKKPPFVLRAVNSFCKLYLTVIRGTPMMVQLLIMGFVIMVPKTEFGMIMCGIITLGINSGAYVAEIARSGLMSVNIGQTEAGRSLGFNYIQTMWYVIIPQAIKNILPALGNEFIILLKDTSLITVIGGKELLYAAQGVMNRTYEAMFPLLGIACIYLVLVLILTWLLDKFERRLRQSDLR